MNRTTQKKLFILFALTFLLSGNLALAHTDVSAFWTPGQPLVPCGGGPNADQPVPCDKCQLLHLTRHLIDFILVFLTPVLGTLFFIIAGVMLMLGGDNPGMLSRGKSVFKSTFVGIFIVLMAWLITNTLIQTLAKTEYTGTSGSWWTFTCI